MKELDAIREEIDKCDQALVGILEKRLALVEQVAVIKQQAGLPIYHPEREQEVLEALRHRVAEPSHVAPIQTLFKKLMKVSREVQAKRLFPENIVLIGFMGSGKTSISEVLARFLGLKLVELDDLIIRQEKRSIDEIFRTEGEPYFRDLESRLIHRISQEGSQIISCGGGVVLRPENVAALRERGRLVWLKAKAETVYERLKDDQSRPILKNKVNVESICQLIESRQKAYAAAADLEVETDGQEVEALAKQIIYRLFKE